jgi:hypothetical protein
LFVFRRNFVTGGEIYVQYAARPRAMPCRAVPNAARRGALR